MSDRPLQHQGTVIYRPRTSTALTMLTLGLRYDTAKKFNTRVDIDTLTLLDDDCHPTPASGHFNARIVLSTTAWLARPLVTAIAITAERPDYSRDIWLSDLAEVQHGQPAVMTVSGAFDWASRLSIEITSRGTAGELLQQWQISGIFSVEVPALVTGEKKPALRRSGRPSSDAQEEPT